MKRLPLIGVVGLLAGCHAAKTAPPSTEVVHKQASMVDFFPPHPETGQSSRDPKVEPKVLVQLTVYKLTVPAKAVSHGAEFWKHVNEDAIDVGEHDILFANGFRVGVAPRGDWDYFRGILERDTVVSQVSGSAGAGGRALEMPLKQALSEETVMYIHPQRGLVGQVYERCDDLMSINFMPVPRKTGDVRVEVVPLFRSQRTEIAYTARNTPLTSPFTHPDYKFDLKLSVDVPQDNFLIVAPSADADRAASLGNKLLRSVSQGKEYETVLLIAPQPFQFEKPTVPATQPSETAQAVEK
jgi:hypothetical protein